MMNKKPQEPHVKKNAFVHKLYSMLNDPKLSELIWWTDNKEGNTFAVYPGKEFANALTRYFKHGNVASFVRQLHMYGFHKVSDPSSSSAANNENKDSSPVWEFKHSSGKFKKDDESSLAYIKRRSGSNSFRGSYNNNGGMAGNQQASLPQAPPPPRIHSTESLILHASSPSPLSFDSPHAPHPYYPHQYIPNLVYYHHHPVNQHMGTPSHIPVSTPTPTIIPTPGQAHTPVQGTQAQISASRATNSPVQSVLQKSSSRESPDYYPHTSYGTSAPGIPHHEQRHSHPEIHTHSNRSPNLKSGSNSNSHTRSHSHSNSYSHSHSHSHSHLYPQPQQHQSQSQPSQGPHSSSSLPQMHPQGPVSASQQLPGAHLNQIHYPFHPHIQGYQLTNPDNGSPMYSDSVQSRHNSMESIKNSTNNAETAQHDNAFNHNREQNEQHINQNAQGQSQHPIHYNPILQFRKIWDNNNLQTSRPRNPSLLYDPLAPAPPQAPTLAQIQTLPTSPSVAGGGSLPSMQPPLDPGQQNMYSYIGGSNKSSISSTTSTRDSIDSKSSVKLPPPSSIHRASVGPTSPKSADLPENRLPRSIPANLESSPAAMKTITANSIPGSPSLQKKTSGVPISSSIYERLRPSLIELHFGSNKHNVVKKTSDSIGSHSSSNSIFSDKSSLSSLSSVKRTSSYGSLSQTSSYETSKKTSMSAAYAPIPHTVDSIHPIRPLSPTYQSPTRRSLTPPPFLPSKIKSNQLPSPILRSSTCGAAYYGQSVRSQTSSPLARMIKSNEHDRSLLVNKEFDNVAPSASATNAPAPTSEKKKVSVNSLLDSPASPKMTTRINSIINEDKEEQSDNVDVSSETETKRQKID